MKKTIKINEAFANFENNSQIQTFFQNTHQNLNFSNN